MSTPSSQAKALVSALTNTRPTILSLAAREAAWRQKKGQLSKTNLDLVLVALKAIGWEGDAPPVQPEADKEREFVIVYSCKNCGASLRDSETYGTEAAIRIELERRARSRLKLHSDIVASGCMGILTPMGLNEK